MIRLIVRTLATILLEIATAAIAAGIVLLTLSAYLTARVVGVSHPAYGRGATVAMRLVRDGVALAMNAKRARNAEAGPASPVDSDSEFRKTVGYGWAGIGEDNGEN